MKYEDSGIMFNNVDGFVYPFGQKIASTSFNVTSDKLINDDYQLSLSEIGGKVDFGAINVVNVDWNGADVNGTIINTTGQLLQKIAATENEVENLKKFHDNDVKLPAKLLAFYTDSDVIVSNLDSVSDIKTFNSEVASFAINDDSVLNKFTVDRSETAQYSVFAWPKTFGTFSVPVAYRSNIYITEFEGQSYNAIISLSKNKAFAPIKVIR